MVEPLSNADGELRRERLLAIRQRIAEVSHRAKSAHLGSSLSCVEILDSVMSAAAIAPDELHRPDRSRIIMSKGHAAMGLYAALEAWNLLDRHHLDHYLEDGTALWGHATRTSAAPVVDVSTGSLGHGLGLAVGYGLAYRLRRLPGRIFAVLSDGECDEGSTWEAAHYAGHHKLAQVSAVVDYNKIQSIGRVEDVLALEPFADKWTSFGWDAIEVDGHDADAITAALSREVDRPRVILAHTVKGKGIARIEDTVASHYHPALADDVSELKKYYA